MLSYAREVVFIFVFCFQFFFGYQMFRNIKANFFISAVILISNMKGIIIHPFFSLMLIQEIAVWFSIDSPYLGKLRQMRHFIDIIDKITLFLHSIRAAAYVAYDIILNGSEKMTALCAFLLFICVEFGKFSFDISDKEINGDKDLLDFANQHLSGRSRTVIRKLNNALNRNHLQFFSDITTDDILAYRDIVKTREKAEMLAKHKEQQRERKEIFRRESKIKRKKKKQQQTKKDQPKNGTTEALSNSVPGWKYSTPITKINLKNKYQIAKNDAEDEKEEVSFFQNHVFKQDGSKSTTKTRGPANVIGFFKIFKSDQAQKIFVSNYVSDGKSHEIIQDASLHSPPAAILSTLILKSNRIGRCGNSSNSASFVLVRSSGIHLKALVTFLADEIVVLDFVNSKHKSQNTNLSKRTYKDCFHRGFKTKKPLVEWMGECGFLPEKV